MAGAYATLASDAAGNVPAAAGADHVLHFQGLMDTQVVNWGALDALVLDYLDQERLLGEDFEDNPLIGPHPHNVRETISLIRALIEAGYIPESLHLLHQYAPMVLEDQRLLFRLYKQNFIELLRAGGPTAHIKAIECSRTQLGPCALNAYPEAYEEFKRVLLALMYDKDDKDSPVAEEWSEVRRAELAATIASTLTAQLQAYDPLLSSTIRYLISVHNGYCQRQALSSPILELCSNLLLKDRDPPATPQECLLEAPKFSESDIQDLAQALELSRQGAVDSLRFTGGDISAAFKNELSRLRVSAAALDELVREYCMYRGLIEGGVNFTQGLKGSSKDAVVAQLSDVLAAGVVNGFKAVGARGPPPELIPTDKCQNGEQATGSVLNSAASDCQLAMVLHEDLSGVTGFQDSMDFSPSKGSQDVQDDVIMEEPGVLISEVAGESLSQGSCSMIAREENHNSGMCSTSGSIHVNVNGRLASSLVDSSKDRRSRRWKGRRPSVEVKNYVEALRGSSSGCSERQKGAKANDAEGSATLTDTKMDHDDDVFEMYTRALEIKQLAIEGKTDAVILEVCKLNPDFFEQNPQLLFQLKQVEFLKLVEGGDYFGAVGVARADLGPLAARFPDLLRPLKETLLSLARPRSEPFIKQSPPSVLAAALQLALGASLGISEPQLMKMMRATLFTHTQWFKLQMCSDRFADFLSINMLKEPDAVAETSEPKPMEDSKTVGGSSSCISTSETSGSQLPDGPRNGPLFDDGSILTLMEFLALSRGDAIQLLVQYDGSVDNVFAHLMS